MSYAVDKLYSHPLALQQLQETGAGTLISVHFMPQNTCNQRCSFCSYRLPDNKNSEAFDEGKHIPLQSMYALLEDFAAMGVKGVEVTGGGEPLAYPFTEELWQWFAKNDIATALVTNGTLIKDHAPLLTQKMKWARVSIDAANAYTYAAMRRCPDQHHARAWDAVTKLREAAPPDPEFRLGVGFVLCNENIGEVYDFVDRAKGSGADNVRLSMTFSDKHLDFFTDKAALHAAVTASETAKASFEDSHFKVHNLIPARFWEQQYPHQDYNHCVTKDLLCVVEGEGKVYTCCTFTGTLSGLYGKFTEHAGGFRGLWEEKDEWRRNFDAREECQCACLYRDRNLAMIDMIKSGAVGDEGSHLHHEFI